jgi:hypothetical protein
MARNLSPSGADNHGYRHAIYGFYMTYINLDFFGFFEGVRIPQI